MTERKLNIEEMKILKTIMMIAVIGLLAACSKDINDEQTAPMSDASIKMVRASRSIMGVETYGDIRALVAATGDESYADGVFKYMGGSQWKTQLKLKSGEKTYRLYGFMPDNVVFTRSITDWNDDGAVLHIGHMNALTTDDYCVVSGVRQVENDQDDTKAIRGNFAFTYNSNRENYINLLFDHLYARLVFSIRVDPDYSQLRTIKVTSMKMEISNFSEFSADITLKTGEGVNNVAFTVTGTEKSTTVIKDENTEAQTLTTTYTSVSSVQIVPDADMFNNIRLITEYEVYDRQGNKIDERKAINKLAETLDDLERGEERTLLLTVDPSYLYVLSDQDPPLIIIKE